MCNSPPGFMAHPQVSMFSSPRAFVWPFLRPRRLAIVTMLLRTVLLLALVVSSLGATHNVSVNESNQTAIDNATADVMFAPHTVGTVSNMTIMANLTMGRTIGDPMWTRWTYINLHYPAYSMCPPPPRRV